MNETHFDKYGIKIKHVRDGRLWWCSRSYYDDTHDSDGNVSRIITKEEWQKEVIRELSNVDELNIVWIYIIFHDKDRDKNGNCKPLHVHFLVRTFDKITQSTAMKRFKCLHKEDCQIPVETVLPARYLTHRTEKAAFECNYTYGEDAVYAFFNKDVKHPKSYRERIAYSPYVRKKAIENNNILPR